MFFNRIRSRITFALLIFLFPLASLSAQFVLDDIHWAGLAGIFHFAADNGVNSDPPPILPSLGVSAGWQFRDYLRVEATEDIYITNYEYDAERNIAMPCNLENRSALVIGLVTGVQITGVFPINEKGIQIRAYGGPAIDIRIVVLAAGLNHPGDFSGDIKTDAKLQTDAIRKYLWSDLHWFIPTAGFGMDFPITEKFLLGFDIRAWFPVYKLFAENKTSALDGWRFGVGLRVTPRKKTGTAQQASSLPASEQEDAQD